MPILHLEIYLDDTASLSFRVKTKARRLQCPSCGTMCFFCTHHVYSHAGKLAKNVPTWLLLSVLLTSLPTVTTKGGLEFDSPRRLLFRAVTIKDINSRLSHFKSHSLVFLQPGWHTFSA